ncbi:short chain dehydrogenase reductase family [Fusarium sporotrichioides]|uniref:Short chain dehydrogenase reductase family n=1 Tax=Fusarium sporotrichioides TaxID=5514 RepID=A0A395S2M3_FUSSP|nr:short chain dehydrogenase reductase family [Fusarium sporotrichioides]
MDISSEKPVLFFDIDNCLYSRNYKVLELMSGLIDSYFKTHLGLSPEEAERLHKDYYQQYGQAIEGLVRDYQIDALDYNAKVDDALPLDDLIKPNPQLRQFLQDIDTSKVRLWLLTNAYVNHGKRVVGLLGVEDLFEGLTYCDYTQVPFVCKPQKEMFSKAMREAGISETSKCYFIDDSHKNCVGAQKAGWTAIHYVEEGFPLPDTQASQHQIRSLEELRSLYPEFFRVSNLVREAVLPGEHVKLILCFDGTGNTFSGTNADTNVVKILRKLDRNHPKQYHYYQTGIGTYDVNESSVHKTALGEIRSSVSKSIDQGFGTTFDAHIMAGYRFLMRYYEPEAKIYIFGFSRGAFTAKYLARMVNKVGLLCKGNEEMVPFAYKLYQRALKCESDDAVAAQKCTSTAAKPHPEHDNLLARDGTANDGDGPQDKAANFIAGQAHVKTSKIARAARKEVEAFSQTFCRNEGADPTKHDNIKVFFLGMWDCVNSVAVVEKNAPAPVEVAGTAAHVRHAVAVDERRVKFKPALLAQDIRKDARNNDEEDILEVWFPGNHGDIGGGWPAMPTDKPPSEMGYLERLRHIFSTMKQSTMEEPLDDDALQMSDMALDWMIREVDVVGREHPESAVRWCHTVEGFVKNMSDKERVTTHVVKGFMHDTLSFGYGSAFFKVLMWKFMEMLPGIPRWELNDSPDKEGWESHRLWPNFGACRDIPRGAKLHNSLRERLNEMSAKKYSPQNNHGAGKGVLRNDQGAVAPMVQVEYEVPKDIRIKEDEAWNKRHQLFQFAQTVKRVNGVN